MTERCLVTAMICGPCHVCCKQTIRSEPGYTTTVTHMPIIGQFYCAKCCPKCNTAQPAATLDLQPAVR